MRSILQRVALIVAGIATVAVLFRAAWVASHIDAGWEELRDGLIAGLPPTLQSHSQADDLLALQNWQWILAQADRLLADRNAIAADFAGGAIAIASAFAAPPYARQSTAVISRIIWGYRTSPSSTNRQLDDETIRLFRQLCSKMRLLAKKATEMEPGQRDWWRLRALLAGHNRSFGELADPDAIVQGAAHDPDNALYDYLRAFMEQ